MMTFPGILPHLNSILQTPGVPDQPALWHTFHTSHIGHIVDELNTLLPEAYIAYAEQSLQVRSSDWEFGRPQPDVSVFHPSGMPAGSAAQTTIQPTWEADLLATVENLQHPYAAVVREVSDQNRLGRIVTRIELLSPWNKRRDSAYHDRRAEFLQTGVPLVEIDYLHETPSPIQTLPRYPADLDSLPYYIAVSDPRSGHVRVYGFGLAKPIKPFPLPLAGDDVVILDLNPIYRHTVERGRWLHIIDTTQLPERFETYRENDRQYILEQMKQ